ncbi:hypothetical protein CC80DRAFT_502223 [Byssothecium circinans]|uniref:Uncharacterized protein n=1 Tax=Byssothecium circinans TaxID=147558 RepID=A0A6A5U3A5_9PLEO|nr:hypothetical protein CC80DRAFT_502223 [Byssothecium circinans]
MPTEFVASSHPSICSELSNSSRTSAKPMDSEAQSQSESRPSFESTDSLAKGKDQASSNKSTTGMRAAIYKAAHRLTSSSHSRKDHESLAGSAEDFEKEKTQEVEARKREKEYESFGLGKKGLGKGGVQMGG